MEEVGNPCGEKDKPTQGRLQTQPRGKPRKWKGSSPTNHPEATTNPKIQVQKSRFKNPGSQSRFKEAVPRHHRPPVCFSYKYAVCGDPNCKYRHPRVRPTPDLDQGEPAPRPVCNTYVAAPYHDNESTTPDHPVMQMQQPVHSPMPHAVDHATIKQSDTPVVCLDACVQAGPIRIFVRPPSTGPKVSTPLGPSSFVPVSPEVFYLSFLLSCVANPSLLSASPVLLPCRFGHGQCAYISDSETLSDCPSDCEARVVVLQLMQQ